LLKTQVENIHMWKINPLKPQSGKKWEIYEEVKYP